MASAAGASAAGASTKASPWKTSTGNLERQFGVRRQVLQQWASTAGTSTMASTAGASTVASTATVHKRKRDPAEVAESAAVEDTADAFPRWPAPLSHDLVYAGAFESDDMEERRRCREYLRNPSLFIGGPVVGAATQEEQDAAHCVRFNKTDAEKFGPLF